MQKKSFKILMIIFILSGIGFICACVYNMYQYFFNSEYVEALSGGRVLYFQNNPMIIYTNNVTDEQIIVSLNYDSSSFNDGDILTMKYSINNPNKILILETSLVLIFIFGINGLIFTSGGSLLLLIRYLKNKNIKNCKENGRRTHAIVTDIITNYNFSIGFDHPHRILCKTNDGKILKSNSYYGEPSVFKPNHIVHIYTIPNTNKYYIDPSSFHSKEDDINYIEY